MELEFLLSLFNSLAIQPKEEKLVGIVINSEMEYAKRQYPTHHRKSAAAN